MNAMKDGAREDLTHAVRERDHTLFQETKDRIEADAGECIEMFSYGNGEIWVEAKPEDPAWFTDIKAEDFEEKKAAVPERGNGVCGPFRAGGGGRREQQRRGNVYGGTTPAVLPQNVGAGRGIHGHAGL